MEEKDFESTLNKFRKQTLLVIYIVVFKYFVIKGNTNTNTYTYIKHRIK